MISLDYNSYSSCSNFIINSFNDYISKRNIVYPKLTNEIISSWDFEKQIDSLSSFDFEFFNSIPNISELSKGNQPMMVKLFCSIQNVSENQMYLQAKYNFKTSSYEINKYFENDNLSTEKEEEQPNDFQYSCSVSPGEILGDRLVLNVTAVEGLNQRFQKEFGYCEGELTKKEYNIKNIYVYDYNSANSKINQNILVLGMAYLKEDQDIISVHAWKIFDNYMFQRINDIFNKRFKEIKTKHSSLTYEFIIKKIKNYFKEILLNDDIGAEYLTTFLFSQSFCKMKDRNIGYLPINLIFKDTVSKEMINSIIIKINAFLEKISLNFKKIKITTDTLNSIPFYSYFDQEKDELIKGALQICDRSNVTLDETELTEGKLEDTGCRNFACIKNLIDCQFITYEYPFNPIQIPHDIELLIFSKEKKSLFHSPFLTIIPMKNEGNSKEEELDEDMIELIFLYVNKIKLDKEYLETLEFSEEISRRIQDDYLSGNNNFNPDDFSLILKISRIHAITYSQKEITYEDYLYARGLENYRKGRLTKNKKNVP